MTITDQQLLAIIKLRTHIIELAKSEISRQLHMIAVNYTLQLQ